MERVTWFFLVYLICCEAASCLTMAAQTNLNITTDRSALLALKDHITSDPQNMILTNWSTTTPICNWVGVICGARHHRVAALNLSYFGLAGTIPPELGNLSLLVDMDIQNNSFQGTLPDELTRLRRLKFINLGYNKFMGVIPSWFGSLSKLQGFMLFGNQFASSIPTAIFNLSALQIFNLSHNQLSGRIPREIRNLTTLKAINLDYNNFIEIPNEIGTLNQLEELFVQNNALKGHIPMVVFNMSSLTRVNFYGNKLNGRIPDNICQHLPNIQELNLGSNQFDGPLPSKLWQCKQLLKLHLGDNKFSGRIPKDIGNLTRIKKIGFYTNSLTGTIPYEFGNLPNLEWLVLQENKLNGHIPSSIFNMSTITLLNLNINQLSGSLPTNIGLALPNLESLAVAANHLSGVIPKFISNASELWLLELGGNSFSGFIPSTLCLLTNLEWLGLSENNLTIDTSTPEVNILSCLPNLRNLRWLNFENNPLNAKLLIPFSNISASLQKLYLENCSLRGNIPSDIGNLSSLILLGLQDNQLSGPIPSSMGRLHNLQALGMYDNTLQGYIPDELCQLENLFVLYLGGNQLSGSVPSCLGNLTASLRGLSLGSNLLNSTIPSSLWGLTDILGLDLSSNSLIGPLSGAVGNLKAAIYINVSYNQLSGSVPSSIGSLVSLVNLSLAHNNLEGPIPSSFATCVSLEGLDLSRNSFTGVIPKSLEALLYLKHLNLSFNRLQGEIPSGGPFKNFSAESFVSNYGLCGGSQFQVPPCKRKTSISILKSIIPGILSATLLAASIIWMLMLRRKKNATAAAHIILMPQVLCRRVSYQELLCATDGFNESNLLGIGGFGSVYKGTFPDETDVAIKVFNLDLEGAFASFEVECEMLSNVRHRNLVKVISCCSQIDFKGLVLNYMPNGSLEKWLYSQNSSLDLVQRLDIMIDVALALEYLHHDYEVPIVHCDLKPSNILLDDDMVAHVADFGIAKLLGGGDSMTQTMTLATIGYIAPEYGTEGIVTRRGDVYSFGIVVMETFTRRKPTDEIFTGEMRISQWVANHLVANAIVDVVDATLLGTEEDHEFVSKRECLSSIMRLAVACSTESLEERISMQEAVAMLKTIKIKFSKQSTAAGGVVLNYRPVW
ncbi:probable LRR receptor-like serine/threonine-protein kinase At3g47570 [Rosa chinensis]|uniref:probable LRR receptor-like serine/threonine-protein kinase At3g47570 n=1 Tax=Rosa chinensis TaxID=74649 RepID=UPI000D08B34F|nr:probable LRR receptor-like serine/threonine-protein kinase At3g47570 [Rosa chinensis]